MVCGNFRFALAVLFNFPRQLIRAGAADAAAPTGPPTVEFAASRFVVAPSASAVSINVDRSGIASGPLNVTYATSDGTAVAGTDYRATMGTLT